MSLKGKTALVTGGAMGIGLATVKRLLKNGVKVTIWDLNQQQLEKVKEDLSIYSESLFVHVCDVTDYKRVDELFEKAFSEMTKIDYLINNAGFVKGGELIERDFEDWEKTIEINLNSIVYLTQKVLPKMYENNFGHVVNISSASSTLGVPNLAVYTATKWGVWGFTESMRFEAQKRNKNVKFSSIHPSYIKTGMFEGAKLGFLGNLIVPLVKDHDVIAKGIVEDALKKGKYAVLRPRTLRLSILLRGILPDKLFQQLMKIMGVHNSMSSFKGRGN